MNALPADLRLPIRDSFYEVLDNFSLGIGARAQNGRFYRFTSTTAATANEEFSIVHGLGIAPLQIIPVLTLTNVGEKTGLELTVSRAADAERIYLKCPSTGVVFSFFAET